MTDREYIIHIILRNNAERTVCGKDVIHQRVAFTVGLSNAWIVTCKTCKRLIAKLAPLRRPWPLR